MSKGREAGLFHIDNDEGAERIYQRYHKTGGEWIVEEKVVQSQEMAQWNGSAVNTIRVPSFLNDGKWAVIGTAMRMGRKGAVVDNACAGGLVVCLDSESGEIYTDGFDEQHGIYYQKHPDSGLTFKGWKVPKWDELMILTEQIHRQIPQHKYVGWDFALTDSGWVLIEGNWGNFMSQYTEKKGLKKEIFELLGVESE